jgi:hypothetical protein
MRTSIALIGFVVVIIPVGVVIYRELIKYLRNR